MLSYEEFMEIYNNASEETKTEIEETLRMLQTSPVYLGEAPCKCQTFPVSSH